jgi:hypothetical protein
LGAGSAGDEIGFEVVESADHLRTDLEHGTPNAGVFVLTGGVSPVPPPESAAAIPTPGTSLPSPAAPTPTRSRPNRPWRAPCRAPPRRDPGAPGRPDPPARRATERSRGHRPARGIQVAVPQHLSRTADRPAHPRPAPEGDRRPASARAPRVADGYRLGAARRRSGWLWNAHQTAAASMNLLRVVSAAFGWSPSTALLTAKNSDILSARLRAEVQLAMCRPVSGWPTWAANSPAAASVHLSMSSQVGCPVLKESICSAVRPTLSYTSKSGLVQYKEEKPFGRATWRAWVSGAALHAWRATAGRAAGLCRDGW